MGKTRLARLQQSEKAMAMGKLAAGLAHEINNPLGVILCYTRLLWNDGKSENAADLDIIIRHTLQARKVLLDLMRFAKPKPATLRALNLSEAVSFIARVFQVRASAQEVDLITGLPPDLPLVRGDDGSVEQVVTNILINSMDALEEVRGSRPGRITVAARHDAKNAEVVLTVSDNGPGISEADLPRVFDPFFSTKEEGKNSGLGLSVAYGLIRDMGGRIEVQSREETVFTVRFRVAGAAEEEEPHAADAHA
jgi:signal transduction histidine kinase